VEHDDRRIEQYLNGLLRNGERFIRDFKISAVPTAYIGGGTPSLLGPAGIGRLLDGLAGLWNHRPQEITVEANPESADEGFLSACRDRGVTRLSLGVQTFHDPSRKAVGRTGGPRLVEERLQLTREVFGGAFSADLIAGLPFQDESVLLEDLERVLSYQPEHLSLYGLTLEPETPLARAVPDQDVRDALWIAGRDALEKAGYEQYEVSNFSRSPETRSAHNLRYWRMESWLGVGAAGSSTLIDDETGTALRLTFAPNLDAYINGTLDPSAEPLDFLTLIKETLLMGFRLRDGPDETLFQKRFGGSIERYIPHTAAAWRDKGLLKSNPLSLTTEGLLFLNRFLTEAFEELDLVQPKGRGVIPGEAGVRP
jgi:oxygen-independent coproporphyrinogen-3 oxidase